MQSSWLWFVYSSKQGEYVHSKQDSRMSLSEIVFLIIVGVVVFNYFKPSADIQAQNTVLDTNYQLQKVKIFNSKDVDMETAINEWLYKNEGVVIIHVTHTGDNSHGSEIAIFYDTGRNLHKLPPSELSPSN